MMAYPHYPYHPGLCISIIKHTATPYVSYTRRDMQQPRITGRRLAPAKLHVIHRLTDEPVMGLRQVVPDLRLYSLCIQVSLLS